MTTETTNTESLIDSLTKLQTVYSDRDTDTHRAVHDAVSAVLDRKCASRVVVLGVDNLLAHYVAKADLPDVERAERYLAECWAEHTAAKS